MTDCGPVLEAPVVETRAWVRIGPGRTQLRGGVRRGANVRLTACEPRGTDSDGAIPTADSIGVLTARAGVLSLQYVLQTAQPLRRREPAGRRVQAATCAYGTRAGPLVAAAEEPVARWSSRVGSDALVTRGVAAARAAGRMSVRVSRRYRRPEVSTRLGRELGATHADYNAGLVVACNVTKGQPDPLGRGRERVAVAGRVAVP